MNSAISNLVLQKMSADEARLFRLYGKLPNKKDLLQNKLKVRFQPLCTTPLIRPRTDHVL
jgi:hypothetical protein